MDAMGVSYEYEREAYDLDGLFYLPDFWLPQMRAHLEIKPSPRQPTKQRKRSGLAKHTAFPVYIIFGSPEVPWHNNEPSSEKRIQDRMDEMRKKANTLDGTARIGGVSVHTVTGANFNSTDAQTDKMRLPRKASMVTKDITMTLQNSCPHTRKPKATD